MLIREHLKNNSLEVDVVKFYKRDVIAFLKEKIETTDYVEKTEERRFLNKKLCDIPCSVRIENSLGKIGIIDLYDLEDFLKKEWSLNKRSFCEAFTDVPGFWIKSYSELKDVLKERRLEIIKYGEIVLI
jgi:hypothetical protein